MKIIILLISLFFSSLFFSSGVLASPDWATLEKVGKFWICRDKFNVGRFYYMPTYLIVRKIYHTNEGDESIYKIEVENSASEEERQQLREILGVYASIRAMGILGLKVSIFKTQEGEKFDYPLTLKTQYFSGDLTHWALPSRIILRVPVQFEPQFENIISFQLVLPYQYDVTVARIPEKEKFRDLIISLYLKKEEE